LALEFLKTKGFENFSYQDLANELDITKASVHHHFPKKADLGNALCDAIHDWHLRAFAKVTTSDCNSMEKLELYINGLRSFACGSAKVCPLSSLQADIASLPDNMRKAIKRLDEEELAFIANILEEGRVKGELSFSGSSKHQALLFVLSCKGALQYSRVHGGSIIDDAISQTKAQLLGNL